MAPKRLLLAALCVMAGKCSFNTDFQDLTILQKLLSSVNFLGLGLA